MLKKKWLLICILAFGTIEASTVTESEESVTINERAICQPVRHGRRGPTGATGTTGVTGPAGNGTVNGFARNAVGDFPIIQSTSFIFPFQPSSFLGTGITFNSSDNSFTVSESGRYRVTFNGNGFFFLTSSPSVPANGIAIWSLQVNNTSNPTLTFSPFFLGNNPLVPDYSVFSTGGSLLVDLVAGDVLTVSLFIFGPSFATPPEPITLHTFDVTGITMVKIQ